MAILFINSSSDLYGADRSLVRTILAIRPLYDKKIIAVLPYHGPLVERLEREQVEVFVMNLAAMRRKYFSPLGVFVWLFKVVFAFFKLLVIGWKYKVKLIHSNTSSVFVGGFVAMALNVPHLWHLREIVVSPKVVSNFIRLLYRYFATKVLAVSSSTSKHLSAGASDLLEKTIVLNNGINLSDYDIHESSGLKEKLGLKSTDHLVGMIGRISHWKGQDLFLKVAKACEKKNAYFLALGSPFTGDEWRLKEFEQQVEALGLQDRFFIEPFNPNISEYLIAFDVFILPSTLPDPFPTTALEAMAHSKAIIANGHGGVLDMIEHEKEGFIVAPNDVDAMVHHLSTFLEDDQLRARLGRNARIKLEKHFTFDTYRENVQRIFKEHLK